MLLNVQELAATMLGSVGGCYGISRMFCVVLACC